MPEDVKNVVKFLFEAGALKNIKRSGWWLAGVKNPESVAEHSFRANLVGYFLAKMEDADADKVLKMLLFHDLIETRLCDVNKVTRHYIDADKAEKEIAEEQAAMLEKFGEEYAELFNEFMERKTNEAIIAKDADYLENAFQAKEYLDVGYKEAQDWLDNIKKALKTESAKSMFKEIINSKETWWKGLKKMD